MERISIYYLSSSIVGAKRRGAGVQVAESASSLLFNIKILELDVTNVNPCKKLKRVTEERDFVKKAATYFANHPE